MPATNEQTRFELLDLLEQLITDPLNEQITPARVREVLSAFIDSFFNKADDQIGLKEIAGLEALLGTFKAAAQLAHYQNTDVGTSSQFFTLQRFSQNQDQGQGITGILFEGPQDGTIAGFGWRWQDADSQPVSEFVYCTELLNPDDPLDATNDWQLFGSGGGSGSFAQNIVVSLSGGKTLGRYQNGQTIPAAGKTFEQVLRDIAIEAIYPTYTPASVSASKNQPDDGEIGESVEVTLSGQFNQNDAGAATATRAYRNNTQLGAQNSGGSISRTLTVVRSGIPTTLRVEADYAAGPRKNVPPANTPDDRTAQVRNPNAPQAGETGLQSNTLTLTGSYRSYFGYSSAASLDMAGLIALGSGVLQNGKNRTVTGVTATADQYTYYCYVASAGDLSGIILDGAAPVLGAFTKLADVTGPNAQGATVTVRVYRSNAKGAFSNNSLAFS